MIVVMSITTALLFLLPAQTPPREYNTCMNTQFLLQSTRYKQSTNRVLASVLSGNNDIYIRRLVLLRSQSTLQGCYFLASVWYVLTKIVYKILNILWCDIKCHPHKKLRKVIRIHDIFCLNLNFHKPFNVMNILVYCISYFEFTPFVTPRKRNN